LLFIFNPQGRAMGLSWHRDIGNVYTYDKNHSYALAGVSQVINK
jgi:hypothetical protein